MPTSSGSLTVAVSRLRAVDSSVVTVRGSGSGTIAAVATTSSGAVGSSGSLGPAGSAVAPSPRSPASALATAGGVKVTVASPAVAASGRQRSPVGSPGTASAAAAVLSSTRLSAGGGPDGSGVRRSSVTVNVPSAGSSAACAAVRS